jgi:hypothetical protein
MTLLPHQSKAEQEHCQEQEVPTIQIIMGMDGGKMMTYSLLQSGQECHHLAPFEGGYDRVGFSLRMQNLINFIPGGVITGEDIRRRTTVAWIETADPNLILNPKERDFWEFGVYSATRFIESDYIVAAVIRNAPHEFLMSLAYTPESYSAHQDEYKPMKIVYKVCALFKLKDNQWNVYNTTTERYT